MAHKLFDHALSSLLLRSPVGQRSIAAQNVINRIGTHGELPHGFETVLGHLALERLGDIGKEACHQHRIPSYIDRHECPQDDASPLAKHEVGNIGCPTAARRYLTGAETY